MTAPTANPHRVPAPVTLSMVAVFIFSADRRREARVRETKVPGLGLWANYGGRASAMTTTKFTFFSHN